MLSLSNLWAAEGIVFSTCSFVCALRVYGRAVVLSSECGRGKRVHLTRRGDAACCQITFNTRST